MGQWSNKELARMKGTINRRSYSPSTDQGESFQARTKPGNTLRAKSIDRLRTTFYVAQESGPVWLLQCLERPLVLDCKILISSLGRDNPVMKSSTGHPYFKPIYNTKMH